MGRMLWGRGSPGKATLRQHTHNNLMQGQAAFDLRRAASPWRDHHQTHTVTASHVLQGEEENVRKDFTGSRSSHTDERLAQNLVGTSICVLCSLPLPCPLQAHRQRDVVTATRRELPPQLEPVPVMADDLFLQPRSVASFPSLFPTDWLHAGAAEAKGAEGDVPDLECVPPHTPSALTLCRLRFSLRHGIVRSSAPFPPAPLPLR